MLTTKIINKELKVTHDSGHVDRYTLADIEKIKADRQALIDLLNNEVANLTLTIAQIKE